MFNGSLIYNCLIVTPADYLAGVTIARTLVEFVCVTPHSWCHTFETLKVYLTRIYFCDTSKTGVTIPGICVTFVCMCDTTQLVSHIWDPESVPYPCLFLWHQELVSHTVPGILAVSVCDTIQQVSHIWNSENALYPYFCDTTKPDFISDAKSWCHKYEWCHIREIKSFGSGVTKIIYLVSHKRDPDSVPVPNFLPGLASERPLIPHAHYEAC